MDIALKILEFFSGLTSVIKIAGGGPVYWGMTILFGVLSLWLGVTLQKARNKKAWEDSQKNTQDQQTSNKTENGQIEDAASKAETKIEVIAKEDPEAEKEPRPRD